MYRWRIVVSAIVLVATAEGAQAACKVVEHCNLRELGVTAGELEEAKALLNRTFAQRRQKDSASSKTVGASQMAAATRPGKTAQNSGKKRTQATPSYSQSLRFYVRQNFEDINLFLAPKDTADAAGAEFSWTMDRVANDRTWSADVTTAVAYSYLNENIRDKFIGVAVAPYAKFTREIHSKNVASNVDVKIFGLSGEIGWKNELIGRGSDYLRGRASLKQDDIKDTAVYSSTVEWLPTWLWRDGTVPGTYLNYNFTPEVKVQYDKTIAAGKTQLFSDRAEAFRVGPQLSLWFKVVDMPSGVLSSVFDRTFGTVTYHWWKEAYSGRDDSWLDASLTHNLDNAGYLALKFAYRYGRNEDTGAKTDLFKISLSAKTCADLLTGVVC